MNALRHAAMLVLVLTSAQSLAEVSHLNVDQREILQLRYIDSGSSPNCVGSTSGTFNEVFPGGGIAPNEYVVPPGKELVITDITWRASPSPQASWVASRSVEVLLSIYTDQGVLNGTLKGLIPTIAGPETDFAEGSTHLVSGVRLASRRSLCGSVRQLGTVVAATSTLQAMTILGYEADKSKQ